ncbi:hypothetical protein GOBAR_AA01625 [Gossypium barbadense]|uniref:DUF4283 domain-containing protein n=1 Tax=Gossypium barbadense TaxID=3634 RepID=A0A2P5YTT4_GOSBA|nr:hypothetical protein GOBAR_AA01625 [Gossypium barbadense]
MANINTVDEDLANLNIMDEEGNPMVVIGDDTAIEQLYELCLHPLRGVTIMEVEDKRILFRFYSEIDLKRVMDSMLWFFSRHLIVFHKLTAGEEPNTVPCWDTVFWVQIHNLPIGSITEGMARQFGDFIGKFLEYDASLVIRGLRAAPRRGGQLVSKWLWEESKTNKWVSIEIDRERKERKFGANVTNNGDYRGGMGLMRHFIRQTRKTIKIRANERSGQIEVREME